MARLRAETRASHVATEQTALSRAMVAGAMTRRAYGAQLACFRAILEVLEGRLETDPDAKVRAVFQPEMRRVPLLDADLAALGAGRELAALPASVRSYRERLGSTALTPAMLLGHLYVFEGSSLGSAFMLPRLVESLGLTQETSAYYRGHGDRTMTHWKSFGGRLDAALADPGDQDAAVAAALEAFLRIAEVFDAISALEAPHEPEPLAKQQRQAQL